MTTLVNGKYPVQREGLRPGHSVDNPPLPGTSTWSPPLCYRCGTSKSCPASLKLKARMYKVAAKGRGNQAHRAASEPVQLDLFADESPEVLRMRPSRIG